MSSAALYEKAASCYYEARLVPDAIRCYRLAGAHRRAADLNISRGAYREAAEDYERSGLPEHAGWVFVHLAHDPVAARVAVTRLTLVPSPERGPDGAARREPPEGTSLRQQLVLAYCDVSEGAPAASILPVIEAVCEELADPDGDRDRFVEEWAISLAEHVHRYDQVALVFAAAMRGRRYGAEQRWVQWAHRVMDMEVTIPVLPVPERPVAGE